MPPVVKSQDIEKRTAAAKSLEHVMPNMKLGLGTGSTSAMMVHLLGEKVKAGFAVDAAVPTSTATKEIAESYGIPIRTLDDVGRLDLTIDGADEADANLALVKGGGGALLHEKIVAAASDRFVVVVDSSKVVERLGAFRVPVEVIRFAARPVKEAIEKIGGAVSLREKNGVTFVTEEGNLIYDCDFGLIEDPGALAESLARIPGLVEHGLFVDMATTLIVGRGEETEVRSR